MNISYSLCFIYNISFIAVGDGNYPFPFTDYKIRYSMFIEENKNGNTVEIEEYYDGIDNVGVAKTIELGKFFGC
jgi:hypothetical protein